MTHFTTRGLVSLVGACCPLELLTKGKTNEEIADVLGCTPRTVTNIRARVAAGTYKCERAVSCYQRRPLP
jgi:predicted transcriptional regulator